jgi:hypothetical protein
VPVITRYLSDANRERAKTELAFLIKYLSLPRFRGELAIEFRGPSELSVYDRGFRLARIRFCRDGGYRITTHRRFVVGSPLEQADAQGDYVTFSATKDSIHALLQSKHIAAMRSCIKGIPHKEEIGVAHVIAADTMSGTDLVIVDREVGDSDAEHRGERLDLLALQQVETEKYRFLAIEVKLGNNPELNTEAQAKMGRRSAVEQVLGYAAQIERCFDDYVACYRNNVSQKIELELLDNGWLEAPTIVRGTKAMLVVAGYSGIASRSLGVISDNYPDLWVKTFDYGLRSKNGAIEGLRNSSFQPTATLASEESTG